MRPIMCSSFGRKRKLKKGSSSSSSSSSSSKQEDIGEANNNNHEAGLLTASSIVEFMKPKCLFRAKKQRKLVLHNNQESDSSISQLVTLQDWLLASPCFNSCGVSHQNQRVYPSLIDKVAEHLLVSGFEGQSMCLDGDDFEDCSSISRSQSGRKTNKRVSFRLPGPDDVILI